MAAELFGELGRALCTIARRPAFGAVTVMVLAIGIAAVSTMFSTLNSVVLRPLPFDRPHQLVWLYSSSQASPRNSTSALDYFDYRQQFKAFESLAATLVFKPTIYLSGRDELEPEPLKYNEVSHNFFTTLGVRPVLGRTFVGAEEEAGAANVVVASYGVWQRRLGGRPDAVGQSLTLDGTSYEVVGVMPADFAFPAEVDLWRPMRRGEQNTDGRGNNNFNMFGRLRPGEPAIGKTLVLPWDPDIRMEVVGVAANIKESGPASDPRPTFYAPLGQLPARSVQLGVRTTGDPMAVVSLVKQAAAAVDPSMGISAFQTMESRFMSRTAAPRFRTVLLSVFGLLSLVMAATGLYGLLAYLVAQRSHELGVRLALGARPREVVWVVVRRGASLAGLGIVCGLGGALALSGAMRGLLYQVSPTDVPTFAGVSLGLGLVAIIACVMPAWRAASLDPVAVLRQD